MNKKLTVSHLDIILNVMCMYVGANYADIDMGEEDWYYKHEWSQRTEKEFKKWGADYIHKIKDAQRELYGRSYMRKEDCIKAMEMLTLNYGWKMKTEN